MYIRRHALDKVYEPGDNSLFFISRRNYGRITTNSLQGKALLNGHRLTKKCGKLRNV